CGSSAAYLLQSLPMHNAACPSDTYFHKVEVTASRGARQTERRAVLPTPL
ncbi:hypothetical protein H257_19424, partial [Aphanomyces astaci]